MDTYISDKEQIEMIKKWWQENGMFTIISIISALVISFGWRYWQNHKNQEMAVASILYEQMLSHEINHQYSDVEFDVTGLQTIYAKTPYASLAAFMSAHNAINNNNLSAALEKFDWVIANAKSADFKQIAKLRKARILLEMKKFNEAVEVLSKVNSIAFITLINEVRGDIYAAKGDKSSALSYYLNALGSLSQDAPNRSFLQMKINQVSS
jgi:predicted negative regulator of RcsB-dependent stress response